MDRDKIIKALECYCESDSFDEPNCKDCPAECVSGYMSIPFIQQVLALLKEQDEQKRKWLQTIADNQLANAPTDTMDATQHTYYDGVWHGLQMAWKILTERR